MIKSANTGSPKEFADELGISESHFHRYIEELQEMGIPILYSRSRKTYYYANNTGFLLSYSLKIISEQGIKEIIGGVQKVPSLLFYEREGALLW
jgi:predicted DNA-binding transcriptional regulator YafY